MMPGYGTLSYIDPGYQTRFLLLLPVVVLSALLCCIIELAVSPFFDNTVRATTAAYLICSGIFILPLLAYEAAGTQLSNSAAARFAIVSSAGGWIEPDARRLARCAELLAYPSDRCRFDLLAHAAHRPCSIGRPAQSWLKK
jgi:hypothetical protein